MTSQDLLKTALLGTARDASPLTREASEGDELAPFFRGESSEKALWNAAVAFSMQARAGRSALKSSARAPEPCPLESSRVLPAPAALRCLFLASKEQNLWREWLQLAAQKSFVAPPEILPDLLDVARGSRDIRTLVLPLLGERGRWLAAQNPDWRTVAAPRADDARETWENGAFPARVEALRETRQADPDLAREWLEEVWGQESAKERLQLIEILGPNLVPGDEAFLEKALDDKSKDVRIQAGEWLSRLPDSAYVSRMWERARQYLKWETRGHLVWKTNSIEVMLPEAWDKSWARDGIFELQSSFARTKLGDKGFWLSQIIARVPPSRWEEQWKADTQAIALATEGEWRDMLLDAFFQAQVRSGDFHWFLDWIGRPETAPLVAEYCLRLPPHIAAIVVEKHVLPGLQGKNNLFDSGETNIRLVQMAQSWNEAVSRWILDDARVKVRAILAKQDNNPREFWSVFGVLSQAHAVKLAPSTLESALTHWPSDDPNWDRAYQYARNFFEAVQNRLDMRRELEIA